MQMNRIGARIESRGKPYEKWTQGERVLQKDIVLVEGLEPEMSRGR